MLALFLSVLLASVSFGEIISYTGRLVDSKGVAITSKKEIRFNIYDSASKGTQLWKSVSYSVTPDTMGIFNVLLGSKGDEISSASLKDTIVFLEVVMDNSPMLPRLALFNSSYSYKNMTPDPASLGDDAIQKVVGGGYMSDVKEYASVNTKNASNNKGISIIPIYGLLLIPQKEVLKSEVE